MKNILHTDKGFGPVSDEQVKQYVPQIFNCGKCSDDDYAVYHNLIGSHYHKPASEIIKLMPADAFYD